MRPKDAEGIANSVDPDQKQSDLGLYCLPRPMCLRLRIITVVSERPNACFCQQPLLIKRSQQMP